MSLTSAAQQKPSPLSPYVKENAPVLEHVRLIDGTGSAPQEDMHEHLFYPTPQQPQGGVAFHGEAADSAPAWILLSRSFSLRIVGGNFEDSRGDVAELSGCDVERIDR